MNWINNTQNLASKVFLMIVGIVSIFVIIYFCVISFDSNGLKLYDKYLSYAFGDYEIVEKKSDKTGDIKSTNYTISYLDANQQKQQFSFNNKGVNDLNKDKYDMTDFINSLLSHANEIALPIFKKDYFDKFLPSSITADFQGISFSIYQTEDGIITEDMLNYRDKKGLRFVDFNILELKDSGLGISFQINCKLAKEDNSKIDEVNKSILKMLTQVYQDADNQDIKANVTYQSKDSSSSMVISYTIEFEPESQIFVIFKS